MNAEKGDVSNLDSASTGSGSSNNHRAKNFFEVFATLEGLYAAKVNSESLNV